MRLENTFTVAAPREEAWRLLSDIPAVVPCMPGAQLVEVVADNTWKTKLHVKLGPIALQFLADVTREEIDEATGRVVLRANAREARGRGSATARIESVVSADEGTGTRVDLHTDLELRGAVAQYGRGVVADVAARLTSDFAGCLAGLLDGSTRAGGTEARPVNGFALLLRALLQALRNRFRS